MLLLLFLFCSILKEHCEIKNEESKKITIKAIGDARVLVNGEVVDDNEEEELHHLDRYILFCLFLSQLLLISQSYWLMLRRVERAG